MLHSEASPCPFKFSFIFLNVIEVELVYNVVLISAIQQNESVIHTYFSIFFSIMVYHRILNIVQYRTLFTLYIRVTILSVLSCVLSTKCTKPLSSVAFSTFTRCAALTPV